MKRTGASVMLGCLSWLTGASAAHASQSLTVEQIVERYVQARGGLEAWHKVQTMAWAGHIESGNAAATGTPFIMELQRPDMTHFELTVEGQKSARTYDGRRGWRVHRAGSGDYEVEDFTPAELNFAREAFGIDGPLMGYKANGVAVALEGTGEVEGHNAYRLNLKYPSGTVHRVWIDAQTFLELRDDRDFKDALGRPGTVSIYYRQYHEFDGIQIPLVVETGVGPGRISDRTVIEKVAINPPLTAQLFAKPLFAKHRSVVTVGGGSDNGLPNTGAAQRPGPSGTH